jgi:protein-disulfide isomerase
MSSAEGAEDLTRKQRREQARSQRRALEEAQRAHAARRRRLTQLGGALAVAIIVVVAAVVLSTSGSKSSHTGIVKPAQSAAVVNPIQSLLAGIPQSANTLGSPSAPVTMEYYGDLQCPVCQVFTLSTMPGVINTYVRPGTLQIKYRSLQTATTDKTTFQTQQVAALAAGQQNKMWQYLELFYHQQGQEGSGYATEQYLQRLAQQVPGLNLASWQSARANTTLSQQVTSDAQAAAQTGFNSTPTLVVRGPHGAKAVAGNAPLSTIAQMIKGVS